MGERGCQGCLQGQLTILKPTPGSNPSFPTNVTHPSYPLIRGSCITICYSVQRNCIILQNICVSMPGLLQGQLTILKPTPGSNPSFPTNVTHPSYPLIRGSCITICYSVQRNCIILQNICVSMPGLLQGQLTILKPQRAHSTLSFPIHSAHTLHTLL